MKKILIALMALATVASAETIVYDSLMGDTANWTNETSGNATWTVAQEKVSVNGWGPHVYSHEFSDPVLQLNMTDTTASLSFSYDLTINHNVALGLTLISTSGNKSLTTGYCGFDDYRCVGGGLSSSTSTSAFYNFKDSGTGKVLTDGYTATETASASIRDTAALRPYTTTVNGTIAWDETLAQYVCTLSSTNGATPQTYELGTDFSVDHIVLSISGNAGNGGSSLSNLSLSYTPEPATATLSLLALAGLAARRRR